MLSSCISHIGVTKVDNSSPAAARKAKGVRYSLPQPFIVGRPGGNGEVSYAIEYFPDPSNEYAVTAWSFMAKHKLDLKRSSKGLLLSAEYSKDDTEVAKTVIDSAGSVAEKFISTQGGGSKGADTNGQPKTLQVVVPENKTVPGPVIYRIVEDPDTGIRLEPVPFHVEIDGSPLNQKDFPTIGTKPEGEKKVSGEPKLTDPLDKVSVVKGTPSTLNFIATFDQPIEIVISSCKLRRNDSSLTDDDRTKLLADPVPGGGSDSKTVALKLLTQAADNTVALENGEYTLILAIKPKGKPEADITKAALTVDVRT